MSIVFVQLYEKRLVAMFFFNILKRIWWNNSRDWSNTAAQVICLFDKTPAKQIKKETIIDLPLKTLEHKGFYKATTERKSKSILAG